MRILLPVLALLLAACTPTTDVVNSWTPASEKPTALHHLFIIGQTPDDHVRRIYEKQCADVFRKAGLTVTASYKVFPQWNDISRDSVRGWLARNTDVDGLITTQLAGIRQARTRLPRDNPFDREAIHFYKPAVSYNYSPTMDAQPEHPMYLAQTNLYVIPQKSLVWTVMTQTPGGVKPATVSRSQCQALVRKMRKNGYIHGR